jgi:hypothetical protein
MAGRVVSMRGAKGMTHVTATPKMPTTQVMERY